MRRARFFRRLQPNPNALVICGDNHDMDRIHFPGSWAGDAARFREVLGSAAGAVDAIRGARFELCAPLEPKPCQALVLEAQLGD